MLSCKVLNQKLNELKRQERRDKAELSRRNAEVKKSWRLGFRGVVQVCGETIKRLFVEQRKQIVVVRAGKDRAPTAVQR